jgi:hypothetical protein
MFGDVPWFSSGKPQKYHKYEYLWVFGFPSRMTILDFFHCDASKKCNVLPIEHMVRYCSSSWPSVPVGDHRFMSIIHKSYMVWRFPKIGVPPNKIILIGFSMK